MERNHRERECRCDSVFSAVLTGIVVVDRRSHRIVDANPLAVRLIGLPKEEILGDVCHRFLCPAEEGQCPMCDLGRPADQTERVLLTAAGRKLPILRTVAAASWQEHEYLVESFVDISDRKRIEDQQGVLLGELRKVNAELTDFASVVSHDLKAPLRGIKILAEWIAKDQADRLNEEGREQVRLLLSRVQRMHNLIDGVLKYSRAGGTEEDKVEIDLSVLVPEIVDAISPPEHIRVTIDSPLPTIRGETTRVIQVFQNLISNAVKFMDKPQGQIRIGCIGEGEFWRFSVSDNGPGIEEKHFDKIFQLFQTLSARDEYESTGVGLAIVKKIVEMHGGRVWVESQVHQGSTFSFTLPRAPQGVRQERIQAGTAC